MSVSSDLGSLGSALRALAAAPAELLVRDTVVDDQYRIERVIGHGAMGVVYLAHDERLERKIALKVARERPGTVEELAALLRVSSSAVKSRLARGRARRRIDRDVR
jgi:serine/threonine protein kinase